MDTKKIGEIIRQLADLLDAETIPENEQTTETTSDEAEKKVVEIPTEVETTEEQPDTKTNEVDSKSDFSKRLEEAMKILKGGQK